MKKLIVLISFLTVFCITANAQWTVGGGLGFGTTSNGKFSVRVAPEARYQVTDYVSFGGRLSYTSGSNTFGIDPYARFDILKPETPIRIFATLHAPFKFASQYFTYGVYLQPGLSIRLSEGVRLELRAGALGWGSIKSGSVTSTGWEATFDTNNIAVGIVFSI